MHPVKGPAVRAPGLPFWRDHFVCGGEVNLDLAPGAYEYQIERGPEYRWLRGRIDVQPSQERSEFTFALERLANLAAEGWWSGDLHVHRSLSEIELLMRAEDLHVAPVITWWNKQNPWTNRPLPQRLVAFDRNRFYETLGGEDEREGGALLFFRLAAPLALTHATRESPSPMEFLLQAKQAGGWVDVEKPFWWDVPTWLAHGQVDSIGLANNHMCRDSMYENEAWGRPRDAQRLPPPRGNGFWSQEIYYHILNCGLRIPPSAGSASGVLPNPAGYNRVYVLTGPELNWERWWDGLRAGRSFVSNGPLLRCRANGQWPGHVFASPLEPVQIALDIRLDSRDPISQIEVIYNGKVVSSAPVKEGLGLIVPPLALTESGWFIVRAIADVTHTFRFASTAPFYVEIGPQKQRISRTSANFFVDWVRERRGRVRVSDPAAQAAVLSYHETAERFWSERVAAANAD